MQTGPGTILEIQREQDGIILARIDCKPDLIPTPGQYLLAHNPDETEAVLGCSLFPMGIDSTPGLVAGPIPATWGPGTTLNLRGPHGSGFNVPTIVTRLALIALDVTAARLLPLIHPGLKNDADIAIFSDAILPALPPAVEIQPLSAIPEALDWANFIAIDTPWQHLPNLRQLLGLTPHDYVPCPAQVLVSIPMPCAGVGECGACAVNASRGYKLACQDGPVFDLNALQW